ncbi:MAG TPA: peptidase U32, partial [Lachnospiraceae bacterium]|nr:peptidase U32 [Lachnospiraceae bacterium]
MNSSVNKPELLIPAGSLDVLKVALDYGADAVYVGGEMFSLRAGAKNFTHDDLMEASRLVHERGKKLYITANITAHEYDLKGVREYFEELKEVKPDALIVSDPGIMSIQREILPDIPIHVSTQANNVNSA